MASNSFDVKFKCQGLRLVIEISSIILGKLVEEPCVGFIRLGKPFCVSCQQENLLAFLCGCVKWCVYYVSQNKTEKARGYGAEKGGFDAEKGRLMR